MKIVAWKAKDGKIFEFEEDYKAHCRKIRKQELLELAQKKAVELQKVWFGENFWNNCKSVTQILRAVEIASPILYERQKERRTWIRKTKGPYEYSVEISTAKYTASNQVSNTHCCPENGVTNWFCKKDLPGGYPGFSGRLDYRVRHSEKIDSLGSDFFAGTRIHTGSGGGGGSKPVSKGVVSTGYGYSFSIFLDDWPALKKAFEEAQIELMLRGNPDPSFAEVGRYLDEIHPASEYQPLSTFDHVADAFKKAGIHMC